MKGHNLAQVSCCRICPCKHLLIYTVTENAMAALEAAPGVLLLGTQKGIALSLDFNTLIWASPATGRLP